MLSHRVTCATNAVAEAKVPVHLIEAWVAGHDEAVRLMKDAKTPAEIGAAMEAELHPQALIEGEVLVGRALGEGLLSIDSHAGLDNVIGIETGSVSPNESRADRQHTNGTDDFMGC